MVLITLAFLLNVLLISFVSAGFYSGYFAKITGFAIAENSCLGADLNNDGKVDIFDYSIFQTSYGKNCNEFICNGADLSGDGKVDIMDWAIFQPNWGRIDCLSGVICTDDDLGLNYYKQGTCTDSNGEMGDGCIIGGEHDGWLREIICQNNTCTMKDYKCPYGCSKGECDEEPIPITCTDSDGGLNPNVFGWTNFKMGSFELKHDDECALVLSYDNNSNPGGWQSITSCSGEDCYVEEAFCRKDENGNYIDADADQLIKCPNGCYEGACAEENQTTPILIDKCADINQTIRDKISSLEAGEYKVIKEEGAKAYKNNYIVLSADGFGFLLKVSEIVNHTVGYSSDQVKFTDVFSGDTYPTTITADGRGQVIINGIIFNVAYYGASSTAGENMYVILDYPFTTGNEKETYYCEPISTAVGVASAEPTEVTFFQAVAEIFKGIFGID